MKNRYLVPFNRMLLGLILLFYSCNQVKTEKEIVLEKESSKTLIKYAKGFDIKQYNGYKKLIIKSPYPDADQYQEFILIANRKADFEGSSKIYVPVQKMVATSTTHIPMIEALGETNSLIGFPNTSYISSKKTVERVKQGLVQDLGNEQDFNTEVLINLQPDIMVAFSMGKSNKLYLNLEKKRNPGCLQWRLA